MQGIMEDNGIETNITSKIDVSVIIPIFNGSKWLKPCFDAILAQTALGKITFEICVCNDASTDDTDELLQSWKETFKENGIHFHMYTNTTGTAKGVGYSKNRCISISNGTYLCFQDVDDVMLPFRILKQLNAAKFLPKNTLLGSQFRRIPEDSTKRYTNWANNLTEEQLHEQIYTSNGPTIIMPTWFCHRELYNSVGEFSEKGKGTPEDLIFFYKHLDLDGKVFRVDECLLEYNYHENATTFSIHEDTIWKLRLEQLEDKVLGKWSKFTIWNAGKQGKKFYNSLSIQNRKKVTAFCDVDVKKIKRSYTPYDAKLRKAGKSVDIKHFKEAEGPFVICVKLGMTDGNFERNLNSLNLIEGTQYVYFS